jgi:hypothetical protein
MRTSFLVVVIPYLLTQAPGAAGQELPAGSAEPFPASVSEASPAVIEDFAPAASPYGHWSVGGEYLIWFLREGHVPPLLTTSGFSSGGRLGEPDTQVLYGNDHLQTRHDNRFFGTRVSLGWTNTEQTFGVEGRAFFLERDSTYFKAVSDGTTLLARPYFSPNGTASSEVFAGPTPLGWTDGGFVGYSRIELFGEEANAVVPLATGGELCCDLLAGTRFLQMRDRLDLIATGHLLPDRTLLFGLGDHYRTHDAFYGGQVGVRCQGTWGNWFVDLRGTAALGGDDQQIQTSGDRTYQTPFQRTVVANGLLVQPGNTGTFERGQVDFVGEAAVNLGYRLTRHASLFVGYTLLYWNNPIRAGDQADLVVNPAKTSVTFKTDAFWAQGFNVGLDLGW